MSSPTSTYILEIAVTPLKINSAYLLGNQLADFWITVSKGIDRNPRGEIKISSVLDIPEIGALTLDEHRGRAGVGLHHVGCMFVHEGGGRRV